MHCTEYVSIPDASVVPTWRKSSYSASDSGDCLEVSDIRPCTCIPVRDSKNPTGPALLFPPEAWRAFVHDICHA